MPETRQEPRLHLLFTSKKMAWNGETVYVESVARELVRRGHRVTVLTHPESRLHERLRGSDVELVDFSFLKSRPGVLVSFFTRARALARLAEERRADLVHSTASFDTWVASFALRLWPRTSYPLPLVRTKHNLSRIHPGWLNRWYYNRGITCLIAPSLAVEEQLGESGIVPASRVTRIVHGLAPGEGYPGTRREARERLGLRENDELVLFTGRLARNKDPDTAVRAACTAARRRPRLKLWMAGLGDDATLERLRALAGDSPVELLGYRDDTPCLLAAADVFIQPSVKEAFGLAVLEAAFAGVPLVVSDASGFRDLVHDRETGLVAPRGDVEALADRIVELLEDRPLAHQLAESARRRAHEEFTLERMVDQTEALYRELLEIEGI